MSFRSFAAFFVLTLGCLGLWGAESPLPVSFELVIGEGGACVVCHVDSGAQVFSDLKVWQKGCGGKEVLGEPGPVEGEFGDLCYMKDFKVALDGEEPWVLDFECCGASQCFPRRYALVEKGGVRILENNPLAEKSLEEEAGGASLLSGFAEMRRCYGYKNGRELMAFLKGEETGGMLLGAGLGLAGLLLLFVGGFLLNLTPCVLPIIPMTLAVLGASRGKAGPLRGLLLGSLYGLGLALTYGVLGGLAILLGGSFGEWHGLWYFRLGLGLLFFGLGLCMLDLFILDWSRFVGRPKALTERRGSLLGAFLLGILAALLAGACVAPVLVYALAQGAEIYNGGSFLGLLLPLVLGLGLASPWPFLGAGLSFLPKPGQFMARLKKGMGIILMLLGLWYGFGGFRLWKSGGVTAENAGRVAGYYYNDNLKGAFEEARKRNVPLVVDFGASWCRACHKMDRTTLREPMVVKALTADFVLLKFQTDGEASDKALAAELMSLKPAGMPALVMLRAK